MIHSYFTGHGNEKEFEADDAVDIREDGDV
jgi:hypothetical protein